MKYKVIFVDVDNTLLDHETHKIPLSTINALNEAHQQGIKLIVATGRSKGLIKHVGLDNKSIIPFDGYVAANGFIIYDSNFNILSAHPFEVNMVNHLIDVCEKNNITIEYVSDDYDYTNHPLTKRNLIACDDAIMPYPMCKKYENETDVYQLLVFADEIEYTKIKDDLSNFKLSRFHQYCLDVFDKKSTKASAVKEYLDMFNISKDEAIAFGDATNDIEMLNTVTNSFAMGNASEDCKKAAKYITDDINKDGIAKALLKLGIIKEIKNG